MKQVKLILSAMFFALIASPAFSSLIVDRVDINEKVNHWGSTSYVHDINDDGFVLGSAISGTLSIAVSDDSSRWDGPEFAIFVVEGFDLDTGGFSFGSAFVNDVEVKALGELNSDGFLNVTIASLWGDFWVGQSVLSVVTEVPEPATFGLMMIGLLSLVFARRRSQFQA